jgi:hypothetical protein
MFFAKPSNGPDAVGGVWPMFYSTSCRNRTGATVVKGEAVQLAFNAGNHQATEIATNDANSYDPGASNDTVWNTVVDPRSNSTATATNASTGIHAGAVIGICVSASVADNAIGEFCFYGLVDALCIESSGSDGAYPGMIVSVTSTNHIDCHVGTNKLVVGFYLQSNDATIATTPVMKQIFLTNGMFLVCNGAQVGGVVRS